MIELAATCIVGSYIGASLWLMFKLFEAIGMAWDDHREQKEKARDARRERRAFVRQHGWPAWYEHFYGRDWHGNPVLPSGTIARLLRSGRVDGWWHARRPYREAP